VLRYAAHDEQFAEHVDHIGRFQLASHSQEDSQALSGAERQESGAGVEVAFPNEGRIL
jgi:hypothetical protein